MFYLHLIPLLPSAASPSLSLLFAYLNSHPVPSLVRRMPVRNEYPPRPWPEFPLSAPCSTDRPMRSADEDALHFCHCRRNLWHFPSWGGPEGIVPFREIIHSPHSTRAKADDRHREGERRDCEIEIALSMCINDGGIIGDAPLSLSLPFRLPGSHDERNATRSEWDTPRASGRGHSL